MGITLHAIYELVLVTPLVASMTATSQVSDVTGNLNLGGATVDVSGKGFRGGGRDLNGGASSTNTDYLASANNANGSKGEGTAGTPRFLINRSNHTLK